MDFEEKKRYHGLGKWAGFITFVLIFSIMLTIISRFTIVPDLMYLSSLAITLFIMLIGFVLGEISK